MFALYVKVYLKFGASRYKSSFGEILKYRVIVAWEWVRIAKEIRRKVTFETCCCERWGFICRNTEKQSYINTEIQTCRNTELYKRKFNLNIWNLVLWNLIVYLETFKNTKSKSKSESCCEIWKLNWGKNTEIVNHII